MKVIPEIQKYMTAMPHTVGSDLTLDRAQKMMTELRVRHLPVLKGGKLVGILSDRDIQMVETFRDVKPREVKVEEAFTPDPYMAKPSAKLDEICEEMATHKYSCVLVVDNNKLVGIFTWVDALNAMGDILKQRFH